MRFLFHAQAGESSLVLGGADSAALHIKALRLQAGSRVNLRNLADDNLYEYEIALLDRRKAVLNLLSSRREIVLGGGGALAWFVTDPKTIEKTLPFLNELGVGKLNLVWGERSQGNFRLDLTRFDRIVAASCEQCGRSRKMIVAEAKLADLTSASADLAVLDFGGEVLTSSNKTRIANKTIVIGAEGGFGARDLELLTPFPKFSLGGALILRSETAAIYAATLI
ncbi:MAG: 16S rRNA (uracil(1498)-N(3))-methyltransferase [Helicobacteraceae bacterium]|jgi:16S rRNA (uracil1498-N3)-methyltransferase|nr:16S rRNA (uracil(1498)-N(3))-methyltransferase [Helicobacteraceae bacterium]